MEYPAQNSPPQAQEPGHSVGHDTMDFMKKNVRAVSIGVGLVIVAVLVVVAYLNQQRRNAETASQMLGAAESPKQLEELLAQYPSSSTAPIAMLALASTQFASGAYDQAYTLYDRFARKYPKHPMVAVAELGKVMCFEARGEAEQALAGFDSFVTAHPDHFLLPQALMGKARCLQQLNRLAEARAVYEDYIAGHPDSEWKTQMEMEMRFMERQKRAPKTDIPAIPFMTPNPPALSSQR
ncbi:MAG: tetratricopeptide repeat protein [Verrucomicrobia bacterium]|nr:tetratricopeptide repeat protein [Verrucomicrobiota bacterium]MBU4427801.1 tetratricopeptide repeat protein [Verrucomicrobiota bacterium]MCG2681372.1 tetratricopeptide repeat protein [Kiritimatiellia bacterium]